MVFKNLCILVLWTKVVSALEGLRSITDLLIKKLLDNVFVSIVFYREMMWRIRILPHGMSPHRVKKS